MTMQTSYPSARASLRSGYLLLLMAVGLPLILLGLAAWQNYEEVLRGADTRVDKTIRILQEHAAKVFDGHRLALGQINTRVKFIDWSRESDREDMHRMLAGIQLLDQVATITITDADGRLLASSRAYPVDRAISFADRDWYIALKQSDPGIYVSRSYTGRQSGRSVFNVASRLYSPNGGFGGAIAISVQRDYFENFYRDVEPSFAQDVVLVRDDGEVLAGRSASAGRVPAPTAATAPSSGDVVERDSEILAVRKIDQLPVFVQFAISRYAALEPWRRNLLGYGVVALLTVVALLAVSWLAIRETMRAQDATVRWQAAAAATASEAAKREAAEGQLRQAQKMEAVGRLTGGIAHDFNNLLTVVIGSLSMFQRKVQLPDAKALRLIDNAIDGANRAAALTQRLLAFSRQQPLAPKPVNVNRLVANMSDLLHHTLGEQIAIESVLAGGLWQTVADPNQLENAVLNLAINARDALGTGGKLTIETGNAYLDESYAAGKPDVKPGQYVLVSVSDTGCGMTREVIQQAFEPFFTTKPAGAGTGLGLSQVYGFVKQSGGHVTIYSEPGEGTTIKLYLPRREGGGLIDEADQVESSAATLAASGEKVLVVEDEALVRDFSAAALADLGFEVIAAGDAVSALALLRAHADIVLLFTDVVLGGSMNGRELADIAVAERPGVKVLFTTGYTRNAIIHHGRLDDGVNFIGKPFTATALAGKVFDVIGQGAGTAAAVGA